MADTICIGKENKEQIKDTSDRVRDLENTVKDLQNKVSNLEKNKVDSDTIHKMDMKLLELSRDIGEMKNNRVEDRQAIVKLNNAVEELATRLEEYLEGNAKILINQELAKAQAKAQAEEIKRSNERTDKSINDILHEIKMMNIRIEQASVINQLRAFYNKSKFNRNISRAGIALGIIFIVSIFSFFTSGGKTFFDLLKSIKEVIL